MWYPIEKANAVNSNTNTNESKKSTNLPKESQNLFMAPPFLLVPGYFALSSLMGFMAIFTPMNGGAVIA